MRHARLLSVSLAGAVLTLGGPASLGAASAPAAAGAGARAFTPPPLCTPEQETVGAADAAVAKECHLKRAVHAAVRKAVVQAQNRKHQPRDKRAATGAKAAQEALQNPGKYAPGYATASGASGTLGQSLTCYMETSGGLATATRRAADKNYPGSPAEKIQWRELKDAAFAASKNLKDAQNAEANTAADTAEAAALQALVDAAWVG